MKMKSAVLASALVAVSSVFATSLYDSDVIYTNWFDQATGGSITEESPVYLGGDAIASPQDGYAVTAQVTVVIHATVPTTPTDITVNSLTVSPKGSICAAVDGVTTNWYGLKYEGSGYVWTALATAENAAFTTPANNTEYTLVTEFDDITDGANRVRYWVNGQCSKWYTSGHKNALTKVGLDGSGSYTKVVGFLVNAWTGTNIDSSIPISISKTMLAAMGVDTANTTPEAIVAALKTPQDNGIAKWANYALGIDGTNEDNKPFAAPVQNSDPAKLTFKLGGVNPVAGTGATVTYGVAVVDSPSDTAEPTEYAGVGDPIELAVPNTVKYYRIKTKIDKTQVGN